MSRRAITSQAQIRRAIRAAQRQGLPIAGVRPDGTLIIGEKLLQPVLTPQQEAETELDQWLRKHARAS